MNKNILNLFTSFSLTLIFILLGCNKDKFKLVEFRSIDADSIQYSEITYVVARPRKDAKRFLEEIKQYPIGYQIKDIYQFDAQRNLRFSKYLFENEEAKKDYINEFGQEAYNYIEDIHNVKSFDCIISGCLLENKKGVEYFVFDENNDEDLSNDSILEFKISKSALNINNSEDTIQIQIAETKVLIEYFDGEKINTKRIPIGFKKVAEHNGHLYYLSHRLINIGYIDFKEIKYLAVIDHNAPEIEYYKYDLIWIDLNNNQKHDQGIDYYQQMYLPFTINGLTYKIDKVDNFGRFIRIEKCAIDQVPPVAIGLESPDFTATTIDSIPFKLSQLKNKVVLLDFWSCDANFCISNLNKIYEKYKDFGLEVVSYFGYGDYKQNLSPENKEIIDSWIHLQGDTIGPIRILYQVGAEQKSFLIDRQGKIVLIEQFSYDKVDKFLASIFH